MISPQQYVDADTSIMESTPIMNWESTGHIINVLTGCSIINFIGTFSLPIWSKLLQEHISFLDNGLPLVIDNIKIYKNTTLISSDNLNSISKDNLFIDYGRYDKEILLNDQYNYPESPLRSFHPKYFRGGCTVQAIFVDTTGELPISEHVLRATVMSRENPTFIILFVNQESNRFLDNSRFLFGIRHIFKLDVTSKFFILLRNDIFLLCIQCVSFRQKQSLQNLQDSLIPLQSSIRALNHIHLKWFDMHKNMNKHYIQYKSHFWTTSKACSFYHNGFDNTDPEDCSYITASSHLNFSMPLTDPNQQYHNPPRRQPFYGKVNTYQMNIYNFIPFRFFTRSKYSTRQQWITVPCPYDIYRHTLYVRKNGPSTDFLVLFRPFGVSTWFAWLGALVITVVALSLVSIKSSASKSSSIFFHFEQRVFWTISTVLQQSDKVATDQIKTDQKEDGGVSILIISWLLASFIICNFYTGSLFSFMTTDSLPTNLPVTLKDVFLSKIFIGTTAYHYHPKYRVKRSILKDIVLPHLISEISDVSNETSSYFYWLRKTMHFVNESNKFELARKIRKSEAINIDGGKTVPVPHKMFAILTSESDLKILDEFIQRGTEYVAVGNQDPTTPFISRTPWIVSRNFFLPLFENVLKRLSESGLYERWTMMWRNSYYFREHMRARYYYWQMQFPASINTDASNAYNNTFFNFVPWYNRPNTTYTRHYIPPTKNLRIKNIHAYLLFGDKRVNLLVEPSPLSMTSTTMPFVISSILHVLCLIIFIVEWVYGLLKEKWKSNQRRDNYLHANETLVIRVQPLYKIA